MILHSGGRLLIEDHWVTGGEQLGEVGEVIMRSSCPQRNQSAYQNVSQMGEGRLTWTTVDDDDWSLGSLEIPVDSVPCFDGQTGFCGWVPGDCVLYVGFGDMPHDLLRHVCGYCCLSSTGAGLLYEKRIM